jgi:hypothetical protein
VAVLAALVMLTQPLAQTAVPVEAVQETTLLPERITEELQHLLVKEIMVELEVLM